MKDVAHMITDIYMGGPLTYPKIFQCDNGSEFKAEVTKLLEKHEVNIRRATTVQDVQKLNDPEKYHQLGLSIYMDQ